MQSEQELLACSCSPSFFPSLISIIQSQEYMISLRHSALITFSKYVRNSWGEISDEIKQVIFDFIIIGVNQCSFELLKSFYSLMINIVELDFYNDKWKEFLSIINENFSNGYGGLLFLNAICSVLRKEEKQIPLEFINELFVQTLNWGINVIHNSNDLFLISLVYKYNVKFLKLKCLQNKVVSFDISYYIQYALNVLELRNEKYFNELLIQVVKLLRWCTIYIPNEMVSGFLNISYKILLDDFETRIKCLVLQFINKAIERENFFDIVIQDYQNLICNLFLQLYQLTDEDKWNATNDVPKFISDNSMLCIDFNDIKSGISIIFKNIVEKQSMVMEFYFEFAWNQYQKYTSGQIHAESLFSVFCLFSSIINLSVKKNKDKVLMFFSSILNLFQDENMFAKAGAFLLLSCANKLKIPNELIQICLSHIVDNSSLVQYYAALCSSIIFSKSSKQIKTELSVSLEQILNVYLKLSSEYENLEISQSLFHLISFFSDKILPVALNLAIELLKIIDVSESQNFDSFSSNTLTIQSLSELIMIIVRNSDFSTLFSLYQYLIHFMETNTNLMNTNINGSYLQLIYQIIQSTDFVKEYWDILKFYPENDFILEYFEIIDLLAFKDTHLSESNEILQTLFNKLLNSIQNISIDNFYKLCPAFDGLLMRLGQLPDVFMNFIYQFVADQIQSDSADLSQLPLIINILFITNAQKTIEMFPLCDALFRFWLDNPLYPYTIATTLILFDELNEQMKISILNVLLDLIGNNITSFYHNFEEEEEEDYDESNSSCNWIDPIQQLNEFYNLFMNISTTNPVIIQHLDRNKMWIIDVIPKFINQIQHNNKHTK